MTTFQKAVLFQLQLVLTNIMLGGVLMGISKILAAG